MTIYKEFQINDYITLKLENGRTKIYIGGKKFRQCRYILVIDPMKSLDSIEDIPEMAVTLYNTFIKRRNEIIPETEFWAHCSNMQVWAENDYALNLLDSHLAEALLLELTKIGDPIAKERFKELLMSRFEPDDKDPWRSFIQNDYIYILKIEQVKELIKKISEKQRNIFKRKTLSHFFQRDSYYKDKVFDRDIIFNFLKELYDKMKLREIILKTLHKKFKWWLVSTIVMIIFIISFPFITINAIMLEYWINVLIYPMLCIILTISLITEYKDLREIKKYVKEKF